MLMLVLVYVELILTVLLHEIHHISWDEKKLITDYFGKSFTQKT